MSRHILALDIAGAPHRWISVRVDAHHYGHNMIAWATGTHEFVAARRSAANDWRAAPDSRQLDWCDQRQGLHGPPLRSSSDAHQGDTARPRALHLRVLRTAASRRSARHGAHRAELETR